MVGTGAHRLPFPIFHLGKRHSHLFPKYLGCGLIFLLHGTFSLHGYRRFVVIRLVAHGNLLPLDLPPQFFVGEPDRTSRGRRLLLPEDVCHVVEEPGHALCQRRAPRIVLWVTSRPGVLAVVFALCVFCMGRIRVLG